MPGLVVRKDNGDLRYYPVFQRDGLCTFIPSKEHGQPETGKEVGEGFKFEKYLPGYWMPSPTTSARRRIGGGNSLIVLEKDGDLKFYPFVGHSFKIPDTGKKVGKGFRPDMDFIVAEWTSSGMSDLLVRDKDGRLRLFPWNGHEFLDLGSREVVGEGFDKDKVTHFFPGYWLGKKNPDLLVREADGDLVLYPFDGVTFKSQGKGRRIGRGFGKDLLVYLVDEWMGNNYPSIIALHKDNKLISYPYGLRQEDGYPAFDNPPYQTVGKGFKSNYTYIVGHFRNPGRPDLVICDDKKRMRFFPFDGQKFVDLGKSEEVGKDWKFTHFWDFYPV
ncbi:MAG: hypothetical protein HXY34_12890 [Candidatus Thorarchaeota archaeon]|nr:hypothetical protein [Candidatus Thorarchaeota archaeon]